jgi:predicted secreted protein
VKPLVTTLALAALAACMSLQPQAPTLVRATRDGGAVRLHKGDTLVVALEASPTPGLRWQPRPMQGAVLQQIGMADLLPQQLAAGAVGAPNDTVYRFRANETGKTTLELALQPAGPGAAPERTVHYEVSVDARPGEYREAWAKTR